VSARSVRRGTSAVAIVLAIALFAGINYLSSRHWARGDWTKTQIYSLSEQTKKVLRHELEQTERERKALELNYQEVLQNLRHAAREARTSVDVRPVADDVTLVPGDNGW
jgi:hypothetical protein